MSAIQYIHMYKKSYKIRKYVHVLLCFLILNIIIMLYNCGLERTDLLLAGGLCVPPQSKQHHGMQQLTRSNLRHA